MVERVFWRRTAGAALGLGAALGCAGAPTPSRTRPLDTPHEAPPMAGEVEWVRPPREPNRAVAWSGDRSLVILGDGTELALWDTPTARPRLSLGKGEHGAFAPSARHLAVSSGATVTVIERATGRAVGTTQLPETQRLVALLEAPLRVVAFHDPQLFAGEAWTRIDVETGARSSLGRVLNITENPIVEVEGKPMAFLSDRHLEPIVGVGADALTRVSAVLASGRVLFRAQSDVWTLTRTKDGEELAVLFPTDATSRPLVVSGSGAFSGAASDFDQLTFAPRGRAGDGPLLGGDDIAARCLRPDLLESFVRGGSIACNAPREKGSPERAP
jgi:hypothetical protein